MSKTMTLGEHVSELKRRVMRILIVVLGITAFVFFFSIQRIQINETQNLLLPIPNPFNNIASLIIHKIVDDVAPDFVQLIVTAPGQAILSELLIAVFCGLIFAMPVIAYELGSFVSPGLHDNERSTIIRLITPITLLFVAGSTFAYYLVIPFAVDFLYTYAQELGALAFITVPELISFVVMFLVGFGLSFQLPVIMWLLTFLGLVEPSFWKENLRIAIVVIIIFGAIITPDGSGVTMWLVALPMLGLYIAGFLYIQKTVKSKKDNKKDIEKEEVK